MKTTLTPTKFIVFSLIATFTSILGTLVAVEAFLRLGAGIQPWQNYPIPGEPVIHQSDPVMGWRNKPGECVFSLAGRSSSLVKMSFGSDGSRATCISRQAGERKIIAVVGCSLTQGWTISDSETYAWKLQARFPDWEVYNYGTGGYGTYQSLLRLEELFSKPGPLPEMVIYGFASFHEDRNVAPWYWLRLLSKFSHRGQVAAPYCDLDPSTGRLRRHPPEAYPAWPLDRSLATVVVAEEAFARFQSRLRVSQRRAVTEQLLLEMSRVCREKGVRFLLALLAQEPGTTDYHSFLDQQQIPYADCLHPGFGTPEFTSGDGHPNGLMNTFWEGRIEQAISLVLR
jgi:hypothetical protein